MIVPGRLSVVTPSFQQAAFLEQSMRSVLDQDYPDLEYIVVDGGSRDGSLELIQRYAHRLAWWVSEADAGQADAINKGFSHATGEFIAWVNSDDYYLPGAASAAVQALKENPNCAMVYGNMVAVNGEGSVINLLRYKPCQLEDLMQFYILGQPAVFFRRSALEKVGGLEPGFHFMLDHHLWIRLAAVAPMRYVDQFWAGARYHAGAKNVAQPEGFTREAYLLVERFLNDPLLGERARRISRRMWAGVHRTGAFYLLDAGKPRQALAAYVRSLLAYPPAALQDWRRILFACASLVMDPAVFKNRFLEQRYEKSRQEARRLGIHS